ncbi:MAG: exodeoxyribonuclease VII small subunit [Selenomonadaceae bacterium]|nr:exodeoxyribonuclease VII small subunit [Selenomonadaceae bacterium]
MPRKKAASFEENLQELEKIVSRLEGGEDPLDEVMADYTRGMELSGKCLEALKKAEEQMDILLAENPDGSVTEQELIIDNKLS